jgi:predicted hotdog family 3-hydroxylacyl-ACP dehydratase
MGLNMDIAEILPHRGPMKFIDKVLAADATSALTSSIVDARWPLIVNNCASVLILVELAAQTAAIFMGWKRKQKNSRIKPQRGWLVGIKSARFFIETIPVYTQVTTRVSQNFVFDNYTELAGEIQMDGQLIASIDVQVLEELAPTLP